MVDREAILKAVRLHAAQNGGKPPGRDRFAQDSGITESAWRGRYWVRWGDLVRDAGFEPGKWNGQVATDDELLRMLADLALDLGRYPVNAERDIRHREDPSFPMKNTFASRLGGQGEQARRLIELAVSEPRYAEVYDMVAGMVADAPAGPVSTQHGSGPGRVYLLRSGTHYKIGKTDQPGRRFRDLQTLVPETLVEVHVLETDDPAGIELYWHRRFADKRIRGEWFELTDADVAAFKRRGSFM